MATIACKNVSFLPTKKVKLLLETVHSNLLSTEAPCNPTHGCIYVYSFSTHDVFSVDSTRAKVEKDGFNWKCRGTKLLEESENYIFRVRYYHCSSNLTKRVYVLRKESSFQILVHYLTTNRKKETTKPLTKKNQFHCCTGQTMVLLAKSFAKNHIQRSTRKESNQLLDLLASKHRKKVHVISTFNKLKKSALQDI